MSSDCILIIDDDQDIRELLLELLESDDRRVCTAENGQNALDLLNSKECQPDLIILDLMMPIMNGWEFMKQMKSAPAFNRIPIIVTSASHNANSLEEAQEFLPKPINFNQLLSLVDQHLVGP